MAVDEDWRVTRVPGKTGQPPSIPGNPALSLASMGIYVFNAQFLYEQLARDTDDPRFQPRLRQGHHSPPGAAISRVRAPLRRQLRRNERQRGLLARRGHSRCLLGSEYGSNPRHAGAQPVRHRMADLDAPGAIAAGQVRLRRRRWAARHGGGFGGIRRLHHQRRDGSRVRCCSPTCACTATAASRTR